MGVRGSLCLKRTAGCFAPRSGVVPRMVIRQSDQSLARDPTDAGRFLNVVKPGSFQATQAWMLRTLLLSGPAMRECLHQLGIWGDKRGISSRFYEAVRVAPRPCDLVGGDRCTRHLKFRCLVDLVDKVEGPKRGEAAR